MVITEDVEQQASAHVNAIAWSGLTPYDWAGLYVWPGPGPCAHTMAPAEIIDFIGWCYGEEAAQRLKIMVH